MKKILVLFILSVSSAFAVESLPPHSYYVSSDTLDPSLDLNTTKVTGKVSIGYSNNVPKGYVSTIDKSQKVQIADDGTFEFTLSSDTASFFVFSKKYGEIVVRGYNFQSQHHVHFKFTFQKKRHRTSGYVVKKPVVYLYSEDELSCSIRYNFHVDLTFSYPDYAEGWNVTVKKNGLIEDQNTGQEFPYLFWEGETSSLSYQVEENVLEGFLIRTDTAISFLENTLAQYGLNQREKTDFITFWAPSLMEEDYALVQFIVDEDYAVNIAFSEVNPKPNAALSLFMYYTPLLNSKVPFKVENPEIIPFSRSGFTFVEWGGAEIPQINSEIN